MQHAQALPSRSARCPVVMAVRPAVRWDAENAHARVSGLALDAAFDYPQHFPKPRASSQGKLMAHGQDRLPACGAATNTSQPCVRLQYSSVSASLHQKVQLVPAVVSWSRKGAKEEKHTYCAAGQKLFDWQWLG